MDEATEDRQEEEGTPPEPSGQPPSEGAPLGRASAGEPLTSDLAEGANAVPPTRGQPAAGVPETVTFSHEGAIGIRWCHAAAWFIVVEEIRPGSIAAASAQVRTPTP